MFSRALVCTEEEVTQEQLNKLTGLKVKTAFFLSF